MSTVDDWDDFARLGGQYFVAGRFALRSRLVPVCANLMHHAVELLLKCGLMRRGGLPAGDIDIHFKKRYGHSLKRLWSDFKACHPETDWAPFDDLVTRLDRWEEIRYPTRGVTMHVYAGGGGLQANPPAGLPQGRHVLYELNTVEMDRLFATLWKGIGINPELFKQLVEMGGPTTVSTYENDNISGVYA